MSTKYFNFNHESDLTPVEVNDETGQVTFTMNGISQSYANMEEFAEMYARARNVLPENLKNWDLQQDGDSYSFVLHAGTAGVALTDEEINALANRLSSQGYTFAQINEITNSLQGVEDTVAESNGKATTSSHGYYDDLSDIIDNLEIDDDPSTVNALNVLQFAYRVQDNGETPTDLIINDSLSVTKSELTAWLADKFEQDSDIDDFEAYRDNYDEYDEYDDYDDDVDIEDIVHDYHEYLKDQVIELANEYQNDFENEFELPMLIILELTNNDYQNESYAKHAFDQAQLAASIANRKVMVKVITVDEYFGDDGEIHAAVKDTQYTLTDNVETSTNKHLYYIDHNFYIVAVNEE